MASTTGAPWNIPFPVVGDKINPLESVFANQASAIHTALNNVQNTLPKSGMRTGTSTERTAFTTAARGTLWLDTNGEGRIYIANGSGGWRLYEGSAVVAAGAWSTVQGNAFAGRAVNVTIPTVIAPDENIAIHVLSVGTGFGNVALSSITRNANNTVLSIRHTQWGSSITNGFSFHWQVVRMS